MRPAGIAGIALIIVGAFILLRGGSFTTKHDVLRVGNVKVTADERQTIPGWAGALAMVAGAVLLVAGLKPRTGGIRTP
jgi:drug/metabolite transporter (DMT)-like permease